MSEQVLQAIFEEMKTASGEERTRLKQRYYLTLYGSSSKSLRRTKQQLLEDLHKAFEVYDRSGRQL